MKALYIWISILVAIALILTWYLIPSFEDMALIELKGGAYRQAKAYYQKQYQDGNDGANIIIPLAKLYAQEGDLDQAIVMIKEYLTRHQNDKFALRLLADFYRLNYQYKEYEQTLMTLQQYTTDAELLSDLSTVFQSQDQNELLLPILEEILTSEDAAQTTFLDLALLYVQKKEYDKARILLEERRSLYPKEITLNDVLFEVWVNFSLNKQKGGETNLPKTATDMLARYLIESNKEQEIYDALESYQSNFPSYTPYLLSQITSLINTSTRLSAFAIQIEWENPYFDRGKLYSDLLSIYNKDKNDPLLQNTLFSILLEKKEESLLVNLIRSGNPENIEDQRIIALCVFALKENHPLLAAEMQKSLSQRYLESHLAISVCLSIAAKQPRALEELDRAIKSQYLTQTERFFLLIVSAAGGFQKQALTLGKKIYPFIGFQEYQLVELALAYIEIERAELLYSMLQKADIASGEKPTGAALAILNTFLGYTQKAAAWIQSHKQIPEYILNTLYTVAEQKKEYPLALYAAKRLKIQYPTPLYRAYYAWALMQAGKIETGMSLLENIYKKHPDDIQIELVYLEGLHLAAKYNKNYLPGLVTFIQKSEKQGNLSPDLEESLARAYLEDLYDFSKASDMFLVLAQKTPANGTAVQTLIYLWGPNPTEKQKEWTLQKALHAPSQDLGAWLSYLLYQRQYDEVLSIFSKREKEDLSIQAHLAYMAALAHKKEKALLKNAICNALPLVSDLKAYQDLSLYADSSGDLNVKREVWSFAIGDYPDSALAWQGYGDATYAMHDNETAKQALEKFFSLCTLKCTEQNRYFESMYEYASVLESERSYSQARLYYKKTIEAIQKTPHPNLALKQIEAISLYSIGKVSEADALMEQILEQSAQNPDVAAAYADMLMDMGAIRGARRILDKAVENAVSEEKGTLIPTQKFLECTR